MSGTKTTSSIPRPTATCSWSTASTVRALEPPSIAARLKRRGALRRLQWPRRHGRRSDPAPSQPPLRHAQAGDGPPLRHGAAAQLRHHRRPGAVIGGHRALSSCARQRNHLFFVRFTEESGRMCDIDRNPFSATLGLASSTRHAAKNNPPSGSAASRGHALQSDTGRPCLSRFFSRPDRLTRPSRPCGIFPALPPCFMFCSQLFCGPLGGDESVRKRPNISTSWALSARAWGQGAHSARRRRAGRASGECGRGS